MNDTISDFVIISLLCL